MPPYTKTLLHAYRLACIIGSLLVDGSDALFARSEPGQPPEYCTVFHHMVKSAGSTIRNILYTATQEEGLPAPRETAIIVET
ncbi:unnamed protein product [Ectocarpus sp. CCAP 1310/34]|nr:unnamed protein product [Ectocarpus sp. CCAP 1310/34]